MIIITVYRLIDQVSKPAAHYRQFICCAMLCTSEAYAVMRCPSVRPSVLLSVTFVYCAKTSNSILKIFSWSDSHTIQVFFDTERYGHISMQSPLTGASNAGEVGKNCGYRPISGFGIDNWVSVLNSFDRGVKFMTETLTTIATQQLTLFMTESVDVVFAARCCMQARPMSSCGVCLSVRLSI